MMFIEPSNRFFNDFSKIAIFTPLGSKNCVYTHAEGFDGVPTTPLVYGYHRGTVQRCFEQEYRVNLRMITVEASVLASVVGNSLFVPRKSSVAW